MTELPATKWTPLTGMPAGAEEWGYRDYDRLQDKWTALREQMTDLPDPENSCLGVYLEGKRRLFAIETGRIEGLYTLRRGVLEELMTVGFDGVRGSDTLERMGDRTIRGLLEDQRSALDRAQETIREGKSLSHDTLCDWHALLTRHQEFLTGRTPDGKFVKAEFSEKDKGAYKTRPNNPRQRDGRIFEYCPPEQCEPEMERMFELYRDIRERGYPVATEAAWLHHRFVRTHPFRDGNGRMARLLMAYAFMRRDLPPPLINTRDRSFYISCLEKADLGDLRPFAEMLQGRGRMILRSSILFAEDALNGEFHLYHANGGETVNGRYYPPHPIQSPGARIDFMDIRPLSKADREAMDSEGGGGRLSVKPEHETERSSNAPTGEGDS